MDSLILNYRQVCQMLQQDPKTVKKYHQQENDPLPILEKATNGKAHKYDANAVLEWYSRRRINNLVTTDEGAVIDYERERARLTKAQADAQELKNEIARKEVAPVKMLEWALSEVALMAKNTFESIPLKIKNRVPQLKASEVEIIKREIVKVQNGFANCQIDWDRYGQ